MTGADDRLIDRASRSQIVSYARTIAKGCLRLSTNSSERAELAAALVRLNLRGGKCRTPKQIDYLERLCRIADAGTVRVGGWQSDRAVVRAVWLITAMDLGMLRTDLPTAINELDELARRLGHNHPAANMITAGQFGAQVMQSQLHGDLSAGCRLAETIAQFRRHKLPPDSPLILMCECWEALLIARTAHQQRNHEVFDTQLKRLDNLGRLSPRTVDRRLLVQIKEYHAHFLSLSVQQDTSAPPLSTKAGKQREVARLRRMADRRGITARERTGHLLQLGLTQSDLGPEHLDDAINNLRAATAAAPPSDTRLVSILGFLGIELLHRYELREHSSDLFEAIRTLKRAREQADGPAHPHWQTASEALGWAYRLSGKRPLGRQVARDGLRGHAWRVLLQSRPGHATAIARTAAADAVEIARWCIEDGDPAGAAHALDAGRGLILQSATQIGGVAQRLADRGHSALAEQWTRDLDKSGGDIDGVDPHLRHAVMSTLAELSSRTRNLYDATHQRVLTPPSHNEVRRTLAELDADALVYLLPPQSEGWNRPTLTQATNTYSRNGAAIVVPTRGEPTWLSLPDLTVAPGTLGDHYLNAAARRDARVVAGLRDLVPPVEAGIPNDHLGELCDWAWTAAVGPLLEHLSMTGLPPVRLPNIVLVPMGELGRVPWHAARFMESGRRHHAIERAVFSYAVSAGSLCDTTALPKLPLFGGLIIADPDAGIPASDLAGARTEAASIRSAFYPDARLVGRNPDGSGASDGPGTRHYVEGWLANAEAGTMLHAACHGIIETRTDDGDTSFLQLAAGDRLTAENLLRGLVGGKRLGLALAVLSACSSNVPGRGYDEALSLASTFLAAGTRTVISSQWRVPDSATSVLMFFFHHYLHNGHSPARALRAAQLWMIDPDRVIPDIVPSSLRHHLLHSDPARIEAWAGFIHFGQ